MNNSTNLISEQSINKAATLQGGWTKARDCSKSAHMHKQCSKVTLPTVSFFQVEGYSNEYHNIEKSPAQLGPALDDTAVSSVLWKSKILGCCSYCTRRCSVSNDTLKVAESAGEIGRAYFRSSAELAGTTSG